MADEDDWEKKEFDVEPIKEVAPPKRSDKWDGEDEEEPVKDNWDDEEEEPTSTTSATSGPKTEKKNKKRLFGKIAEKEREMEEKRLQKLRANMTPAELEAEKLRQLKLQEEADLQLVKQAFGGAGEIDTANPMTKDDFDELRKKIIGELRKFEKRTPFEDFVEDFVQDLLLSLPSKRLKKVKTNVEALYHEKVKTEKEKEKPKSSKAKVGKVKLHVDDAMTTYAPDDLEDFEDFM